jgi:hypothetical protein
MRSNEREALSERVGSRSSCYSETDPEPELMARDRRAGGVRWGLSARTVPLSLMEGGSLE